MASVKVVRLVQTTLMNVPRVKAKDTMPIIPEIRKKGEVVAVVDTTTPMAGPDGRLHSAQRLEW